MKSLRVACQLVPFALSASAATLPISTPNSEDVVALDSFTVTDQRDGYTYCCCGCGGGRRELYQKFGCGEIITRQQLEEATPLTLEGVLDQTIEADLETAGGRELDRRATLDGLPIATPIDPATVDQITLRGLGLRNRNIIQARAPRQSALALTTRGGDEGVAGGTLRGSRLLPGTRNSSALAIISWSNLEHPQTSAFLDVRQQNSNTQLGASLQARDLSGYGKTALLRLAGELRLSGNLTLGAIFLRHVLERDDPMQFRLGSPRATYAGLGFMNLDLLTAETRRLDDTVADLKLSGTHRSSIGNQSWTLRGRWHRQSADWLAPSAVEDATQARRNLTVRATHRGDFFAEKLTTELRLETTTHRTSRSTTNTTRSSAAEAGLQWKLDRAWSVFAEGARSLHAPWTNTGRWRQVAGAWLQEAPSREARRSFRLGLNRDDLGDFAGQLSVYRETATDILYRDWHWAASLGSRAFTIDDTGALRSPTSTSLWPSQERQGWSGTLRYAPLRNWETQFAWFCDWQNSGPYRGGDRRAVLTSRYEFRSGPLVGFAARASLSYRTATIFDDGYTLPGGTKLDLTLVYRVRVWGLRNTLLQLNASNLTDRRWQTTRFAPDHGRELLFSATQRF